MNFIRATTNNLYNNLVDFIKDDYYKFNIDLLEKNYIEAFALDVVDQYKDYLDDPKKHYYTLDVVYTAMETLDDVEQIKSKK